MKRIILIALLSACLQISWIQAQTGNPSPRVSQYLKERAAEIVPKAYHDHPEYGKLALQNHPQAIELIHLRSANSRTFLNESGEYHTQQTGGTFHFRDEQGRWISLQENISVEAENAGIFRSELPLYVNTATGKTTFTLEKQGGAFAYGENTSLQVLDSRGNVLASIAKSYQAGHYAVEQNKVTLNNYFEGIDRIQDFNYWDLQTDFRILEKLDFDEQASFIQLVDELRLPVGCTLEYGEGTQTENGWQGTLRIVSSSGEVLSVISQPLLYDAYASDRKEDHEGHAIQGCYAIEKTSGGYMLALRVPVSWLNSDQLVYPVTIDPTATNTYANTNGLYHNSGFNSGCQATMNVNIPFSYFQVTNTDLSYSIRAKGAITSNHEAWGSEQKSRVGSGSNWTATQTGTGTSSSAQNCNFSLTNQTIANGCYSDVSFVTYNLQGYQTFFPPGCSHTACNVTGCVINYQELRANTWVVTTTYTEKQYAVEWGVSSTGASTWCAGETRSVSLTVRNVGTQSWTSGSGSDIYLSYWWTSGQTNVSNSWIGQFSNLAPGQSQTLTFNVTAPATAGSYTLNADLVRNAVCWFSSNSGVCGPCNTVFTKPSQTVAAALVVNAGVDISTCVGVSKVINATVSGASSQTWSPATALSSTTVVSPTTSATSTIVYTLTATNGICSLSDQVTVTVNSPSSASLSSNDLLFTGAVSNVYENAANWLKWDGSTFAVPSAVPQITDNVRIKPNATCIVNQPTITNLSDAGFSAGSVSANCRNIVIESGATFTFSSNNSHFHVAETWNCSGTVVPGNGRLKFIGNGAQSLTSSSGAHSFYEVNIGANSIMTLNATNLTITNALRLNGIIITGSNILHLSNTAADATSLPALTGQVYGTFRRSIAANTTVYSFPVGVGATLSTHRRLLEFVNNNIAGVSYLDCSVSNTFKGSGSNTDAFLDPLKAKHYGQIFTNVSGDAEWKLTPNAAPSGGTYGVRLYLQNFSALTDNNFAVLKRPDNSTTFFDYSSFYASTSIPPVNTAGRIYSAGAGYAQKTGFSTFSRFAVASAPTPLPVQLLNFSASCEPQATKVAWSTGSEQNSQKFTVEKSRDLSAWNFVSEVLAAGNSNYQIDYTALDLDPMSGILYYRLIQADNDGIEKIYGPISVSCTGSEHGLSVFPNPAENDFTVEITSPSMGNATVQVVDLAGKIVAYRNIHLLEGGNQLPFDAKALQTGTYIVMVISGTGNYKPVKVVVR